MMTVFCKAILICAMLFPLLLLFAQKRNSEQILLPVTSPTSGAEMFRAYCADCHGTNAKGNGPVATVLKVSPPDLTLLSAHNDGKFPYERVTRTINGDIKITAHGSREMPAWGPIFRTVGKDGKSEAHLRIKTLTDYVASLQMQMK